LARVPSTFFGHDPLPKNVEGTRGVWSLLRRGPMANTAFTDYEHLERTLLPALPSERGAR
jgi:hypothetical protein